MLDSDTPHDKDESWRGTFEPLPPLPEVSTYTTVSARFHGEPKYYAVYKLGHANPPALSDLLEIGCTLNELPEIEPMKVVCRISKPEYQEWVSRMHTVNDDTRDTFSTGYQRDQSANKPAYEMLPPDAMEELAILFAEGAKKYGPLNYRKGAPVKRTCASMLRHAFKALRGDEDEGETERSKSVRHFIACAWNALVAAQHIIDMDKGLLPADLDDRAVL